MSENQTLFSEEQKFNQWWLWLLLIGINCPFLYGIYQQLYLGKPFGDKPMSDTGLLLTAFGMLLLLLLFFIFKLQTVIKEDGIYVRFFPFHLTFRKYTWDTISKAYVRKYNPIPEYGGWGLRLGLFGKGTAFNVSGNMGLQLEFTNGKKLLIGTNKPEELEMMLLQLKKLKE